MNLPRFSVKHSLMVNLFSVFVIVAGVLSLVNMRREAFPTFSFDIVTVNTFYPGATPEEIEKLITRPIEEELRGVSDLDEIQSVSVEGFSLITIKIDPDAKKKPQVVMDIRQAVDRVPDLPADLREKPITYEVRSQDHPIIEVALSGEMDRLALQELAENLEDELEELGDVAKIDRGGWQEKQLAVELNLKQLEKYRVAIDEVIDAVRKHDVNVPGGTLDTGKQEFLIRTNNEMKTPEDFERTVVRANEDGEVIRLSDVGTARWAPEEPTTLSRVDGGDAVRLVVIKKEQGDVIRMVREVKETVAGFMKRAPNTLKVAYVNDVSFYVSRRLGILLNNGWIGLILVLLSLFLLLSRPVATWTIVGLPVAMLSSIWIMGMFNISINLITMFGLIMVLGIVVDDAIVVAENTYRYMEEGLSPRKAAIKGTAEVLKPVTVTILTTVVVFLPLALMTGIMGKFVRWIPIVIIITLIASLVECLIVLPSHLADFGRARRKNTDPPKKRSPFRAIQNAYLRLIKALLRHRYVYTISVLVFFAVGIYAGFKTIKLQMFPAQGIEVFFIRAEAKLGTSLEETTNHFKAIEKLVADLPDEELDNYITIVGQIAADSNDPFSRRGSHLGQIIVYLAPEADRGRGAFEVMEALRGPLQKIPNFEKVWLDEVRPGPPTGKPVAIRVQGPNINRLKEIATIVAAEVAKVPGTIDAKDDFDQGKDELRVVVNEAKAAQAKLHPADVGRTVRWAFQGEVATTVQEGDEDTDVIVRLREEDRKSKKTFGRLFIQNPRGFHVPLRNVATVKRAPGIASVKHYDTKRVVTVTANLDERTTSSLEVNNALLPTLASIQEKNPGYILSAGGEYEDTQESMDSLMRAGILALFMVFLILASAFNSLIQPIIVMLAIPFGILAALAALLAHGHALSFLAFLGIIGLAGVVVNDSVILMDFINQRRKEGLERDESILEACKMRLRPVILTSVTTALGLGPVAYGLGGRDPFLVPMALTITWGILLGTMMTLTVIPTAYSVVDDIRTCCNPGYWKKNKDEDLDEI